MSRPKKVLPTYGTTTIKGIQYYRTRIKDADGKRVPLYARTPEELTAKVEEAKRQIEAAAFRLENPTVKDYAEKWLKMHEAHVRDTTLRDYTSKVKIYIIEPLGDKYMAEITPDDVKTAIVKASKQSVSIYRSVQMLYKAIFQSAVESHIIDKSPCASLRQHRIIRQERVAADFASEKGAKTQESFVDFKFEQRISGVKDAANRRRRYCAVLP